ncbi:MAG TPA: hypothetical protein VF806_03805 [Anaerolineaceae bacterium]
MKANWYHSNSGWKKAVAVCPVLVLILAILAGCTSAVAPLPTATQPPAATATQPAAPAAEEPSATPTLPPTATLVPSVTPTLPPTATQVPPLALLPDGFNVWCAPTNYAGTKPASPDTPDYANKLIAMGDRLQVKIPAAYCTVSFRFNQAAPTGATLVFYDGTSPFLKVPLAAADSHPEEVWTSVTHAFVINPPLWEVTYKLSLLDSTGKEIWNAPVKFAKPTPEPCPFGGLPNPVTLYCTKTDPYEIEPHPDVTYPYDRTRVAGNH